MSPFPSCPAFPVPFFRRQSTTVQSPRVSSFQRHTVWDVQARKVSMFLWEAGADFSAYLAALASPEVKGMQSGLDGGIESRLERQREEQPSGCGTDLRSWRKGPCGIQSRTPRLLSRHSGSLWGLSRPVCLSLYHLLKRLSAEFFKIPS